MHKKFSDKYRLLLQKIEVSRDQLDRAVADGDCSAASRELDQILNLAGQVDLLMSAGASIPVTMRALATSSQSHAELLPTLAVDDFKGAQPPGKP